MQPNHTKAYNNRRLAYNELGQYQNAIKDFNKAIILKPDYAATYNNRAFSFFMLGDNISGCSDAKKSCALGVCKTLESASVKGLCR